MQSGRFSRGCRSEWRGDSNWASTIVTLLKLCTNICRMSDKIEKFGDHRKSLAISHLLPSLQNSGSKSSNLLFFNDFKGV